MLPYYILFLRVLRKLSYCSNNLFLLVPIRLYICIKSASWLKKYSKKKVQAKLRTSLGSFSDFEKYSVKNESVIELANLTLEHYFNILGSGLVKLDSIDWHKDFKSGFRWPKGKFYKFYVQVDLNNNADVKVPRELSRSHHLLWLGQAYLISKDEKYSLDFINQINNWIEENPLMYSINWGCAMDVAIRAVNWLYALNMFINSKHVTDQFIRRFTKSLYEHGWFIFNNLEKDFPGSHNHYMSDLVGLIFIGSFFKETRQGKKWLSFAIQEYYYEIRYQILPSGPCYERSTGYHRLMTELLFYTYLLLKRNDINVPSDIRYRIEKMFHFILYYIKPEGTAPIIGDQDNGRLLPFAKYDINDHRYLLCLAASEYNNSLFKKYSNGFVADAFFLQGPESQDIFDCLPPTEEKLLSKSFPDAGFCILRLDDYYMFINNSGAAKYPDHSSEGGSHAHADLLSFELSIGHVSFIVDPGTYVYSASATERNHFRSTRMHNTLVIDNKNQHFLHPEEIFSVKSIARPTEFILKQSTVYDQFVGAHDGYNRLQEPVTHRRIVKFDKTNMVFTIEDYISGFGKHNLQWYFHFNANIELLMVKNNIFEATDIISNQRIILCFHTNKKINCEVIDEHISPSYGIKQNAATLMISTQENCPYYMRTTISKASLVTAETNNDCKD